MASGGAAARAAQAKKEKKKRMPKLEEFLQSRDYVGAMTLLDVSYCLPLMNNPLSLFLSMVQLLLLVTVHTHAHSIYIYLHSSFEVLEKALKTQTCGWHTVHSILETMLKQEQ